MFLRQMMFAHAKTILQQPSCRKISATDFGDGGRTGELTSPVHKSADFSMPNRPGKDAGAAFLLPQHGQLSHARPSSPHRTRQSYFAGAGGSPPTARAAHPAFQSAPKARSPGPLRVAWRSRARAGPPFSTPPPAEHLLARAEGGDAETFLHGHFPSFFAV